MENPPAPSQPPIHTAIVTPLSELHPHPGNYRHHPADQLAHLGQSLREHGMYRNVVATLDGTILAGHGVVEAATLVGLTHLPVVRLDIDPDSAQAKKLLVGDNEIDHLAEDDDRKLTELLREIRLSAEDPDDATLSDAALAGTGYDDMMLANLAMVTRPKREIADHNEAREWVGMPEYEPYQEAIKVIVSFASAADRAAFFRALGMEPTERTKSIWYPPKPTDDPSSVRFVTGDLPAAESPEEAEALDALLGEVAS